MSQDVLLTVMNSMSLIGESVNMVRKRNESCDKCFNLEAELLKSQNAHNDLLKSHSQLEKYYISLELSIQMNQEIFQKDESCNNQNALEILEFFENKDLKVQLQDKDTTICFKDQFDSIKKTRNRTKEQSGSLIDKLNLKSAENKDLKAQIQDKLDLEPLAPRLLQNREAHINYLKYTQEQADILQGIVEQAKATQPIDKELDFTLKCSTSNCGSKPPGNKRNDRILQTPNRKKKNKVEAQLRKVNKTNHVVKLICDVDVKHSLSNVNSEIPCATCNKSVFDGVHDKCLLNPVFTSTNVVSHKQTTSHLDDIQKPEIRVYSRKPKNVKNIGSSKIAKIVESKNANHSEPNQTWGSNATDIPSSSSLVMTGTVRFRNDQIARILGYGDYQLGNVVISRKNTCFIRNLEGVDLLSGSRDINLYTISLDDMLKSSSICLLSKASKTKSSSGKRERTIYLLCWLEVNYISWKFVNHSTFRGKPLGKLIWNSIQNGPSPHPMVTDAPTEGQTGVNMPRMKLDLSLPTP
ncbi:hypothetical protein Tco_1410155 [Tanacetum coccineum]